jgi:hypothetical protein
MTWSSRPSNPRDVSRDQPPAPEDPGPGSGGRIRPTGPGILVVSWAIGLVSGWASRGIAIRAGAATPSVSWLTIGVIWFVAAVTAGTAYLTWSTVQRERRAVDAEQAVARLVFGRTIARLSAFVLGGFLGIAISNLGVDGESSNHVIARALLAAVGAGAALAAGLLLEHACRVPPGGNGDLP